MMLKLVSIQQHVRFNVQLRKFNAEFITDRSFDKRRYFSIENGHCNISQCLPQNELIINPERHSLSEGSQLQNVMLIVCTPNTVHQAPHYHNQGNLCTIYRNNGRKWTGLVHRNK